MSLEVIRVQKADLVDLGDRAALGLLAPIGLNHSIDALLGRLHTNLIYANAQHPRNQFRSVTNGGPEAPLYSSHARMLVHQRLVPVILRAIDHLPEDVDLTIVDALRTVDAQAGMLRVKEQNRWPDHLVSRPGQGAHPRALAFDVMAHQGGHLLDVGVEFDDFDQLDPETGKSLPLDQEGIPRASRKNPFLGGVQRGNRRMIEAALMRAGLEEGTLLMPLPDEDWDFRTPTNIPALWGVLESVARIVGVETTLPDCPDSPIASYADFVSRWVEYFALHRNLVVNELGRFYPPPEEQVMFTSHYAPLLDVDLVSMGFPPMTDGQADEITKKTYADAHRPTYPGHPLRPRASQSPGLIEK